MDEDDINGLLQRCQKLKHKFRRVFAADNFPSKLKSNTFIIVNASKSQSPGTHWLLNCKKATVFCLLIPWTILVFLQEYLSTNCKKMYSFTNYLKTNQFKVKTQNCADSFCIFIAQLVFDNRQNVNCIDFQLVRFALHMML